MFQYVIRAMLAIKKFVSDGSSRSAHENLILFEKLLHMKALFNETLVLTNHD